LQEKAVPRFRHDDVEIAFLDEGEGEPIVLVHGFASNAAVNWVQPGWVAFLKQAGRRVIALDNRGHGASTKLYDPAEYHSARMAADVAALLDHLGLRRADVMGYSMGARSAAFLALRDPQRVHSAVFGGLGRNLIGARVFAAMKPSSYLINLARGGIVDENALLIALERGEIAGAALDVFQEEPLPAGHPLWSAKNVIITAHLGGFCDVYAERALVTVEHNMACFLRGDLDQMINVVRR
jgi:phosphoglycerate dehydrogenase-like enzyme